MNSYGRHRSERLGVGHAFGMNVEAGTLTGLADLRMGPIRLVVLCTMAV